MALEIEGKIKVTSLDVVREGLVAAGWQWLCRATELNTILDTSDRQLLGSGCGLRVRTNRGEGDVPPSTLTYKGPQQAGEMKIREEREVAIGDAEAMIAVLSSLGFAPTMIFEKRREAWRLGDVTVLLDELPLLGCYIEIEGDSEDSIRQTQTAIGLGGEPLVRSSYIALLVEYAQANNLPADRFMFD